MDSLESQQKCLEVCNAGLLGAEYRTLDGSGNNLRHPSWGVSGVTFLRYPPYHPRYAADNSSMVAGLPNQGTMSRNPPSRLWGRVFVVVF